MSKEGKRGRFTKEGIRCGVDYCQPIHNSHLFPVPCFHPLPYRNTPTPSTAYSHWRWYIVCFCLSVHMATGHWWPLGAHRHNVTSASITTLLLAEYAFCQWCWQMRYNFGALSSKGKQVHCLFARVFHNLDIPFQKAPALIATCCISSGEALSTAPCRELQTGSHGKRL